MTKGEEKLSLKEMVEQLRFDRQLRMLLCFIAMELCFLGGLFVCVLYLTASKGARQAGCRLCLLTRV